MPNKQVHWADDDARNNRDLEETFSSPIPLTPQTIADDDSLVDSPLVLTPPPPALFDFGTASSSSPRNRPRASSHAVRASYTTGATSSPESRVWRPEESIPGGSPLRMRNLARMLPSLSPSNKSNAPRLSPSASNPPDEETKLHLLLNYSELPQPLSIYWDLRDAPSTSTVRMIVLGHGPNPIPATSDYLLSPATSPPTKEMRISCIGHGLWEPIVIRADELSSPQSSIQSTGRSRSGSTSTTSYSPQRSLNTSNFVSVLQVLRALHKFFSKRITQEEYDALEELTIPNLRVEVTRSFYVRVSEEERRSQEVGGSGSPSSHVSPRQRDSQRYRNNKVYLDGVKRIDCLLGQFLFLGLEELSSGRYSVRVTKMPS